MTKYLYSVHRSEEDHARGRGPSFERHRITRKTPKYVFFVSWGEPCDVYGNIDADWFYSRRSSIVIDDEDIVRVDREDLEREGEISLRRWPYRVCTSLDRWAEETLP